MEKVINLLVSLIFIICFSSFQSSCSLNKGEVLSTKYKLTANDIEAVLSLIEPEKNQELNFHILYTEFFNDSTFEIQIVQHGQLTSENELIDKVFEYNGSKVFMYEDILKDNANQKEIDLSPFFVVHANYWSVLVKRRNEQNQYYKVEIFSNYSDSLQLEEGTDMY
ncbi:hypothetical protein GCM10011506_38060 [Marivirga lumbricoides]|uniref:Lipoprotein n=1 Tax=Marivirga lumbricoides TaxID=1046115 RepID=A0ABQ1N0U4_9BACT|nr:hypothetical protein GCM10011506_38060 [Marivirga lumbricoides]